MVTPPAVSDSVAETVEPRWLRVVVFGAAASVLAFGAAGLLLAINGVYTPAAAFSLGVVALAAIVACAFPFLARPGSSMRSAHAAAAVAVVAVLSLTGWNAAHASQHVLINRDGGAYANAARWIARDGSLDVPARTRPFATEPSLRYASFGTYQMPDGSVQIQFAHLLPVLLAEGYAIAGDRGLFHGPELLSGIALLVFFALAWRLLRRPWFALGAMLALAFLIPQVSFSRDSYSEIPSQVLLFTAVWLLTSDRLLPRPRVAFACGLFIGALEAVRIDAIVFLVGIPPLAAIAWLSTPSDRAARRDVAVRISAFALGIVPPFVLGLVDLAHHSGGYWSDLRSDVHQLFAAVGASLVASALAVVLWPSVRRVLGRIRAQSVAVAVGAVIIVAGFGAWILRPRLQTLHGATNGLVAGLQRAEHARVIDATRTYAEYSITWISWYAGPITVAAAIIGAGLLAAALLQRRWLHALGAAALLGPASLLYLWSAKASADHVWVTRRFLISAFPAVILLAFSCAVALWGRREAIPRIVAAVFAVVAVVYPLHALRYVRNMTEQRGYLTSIEDACHTLGPHAAVVVLASHTSSVPLFDSWTPQTLRGWCGADVAIMPHPDAATLSRLAGAWSAAGRQLYVAAASPEVIHAVLPAANVTSTPVVTNARLLQQTLTHRPDRYQRQSYGLSLAAVPVS